MSKKDIDILHAAFASHQHKKGGYYLELCRATLESDLTPVVVYKAMKDGTVWVRPASEFDDPARFKPL